ncbi:MAG TPA: hypothetical protein VNE82_10985 [Candidatus Binataceae bacterium]|nr:hypothetical protein [Candidatus Binataceae bacterium]
MEAYANDEDNNVTPEELRRQLRDLTSLDPLRTIVSVDPAAEVSLRQMLRENASWLSRGTLEDSKGQEVDIVDALLDPKILGDLPHLHRDSVLFAVIRNRGTMSSLVLLENRMTLQLEMPPRKPYPLRLTLEGLGTLFLEKRGARQLVCITGFHRT